MVPFSFTRVCGIQAVPGTPSRPLDGKRLSRQEKRALRGIQKASDAAQDAGLAIFDEETR